MSKREESKYKINRRLGVNLWGRAKSPLNRREYGPGQHGQRRKKPSDYGTQLAAKQKLKGYYANIGERQFRKLYEEAVRRRGDTGENLPGVVEQTAAGLGQNDRARQAIEQLLVQLRFQLLDLLAQRRLGDMLAFRRMREAPLFHYRHKVPELMNLHRGILGCERRFVEVLGFFAGRAVALHLKARPRLRLRFGLRQLSAFGFPLPPSAFRIPQLKAL